MTTANVLHCCCYARQYYSGTGLTIQEPGQLLRGARGVCVVGRSLCNRCMQHAFEYSYHCRGDGMQQQEVAKLIYKLPNQNGSIAAAVFNTAVVIFTQLGRTLSTGALAMYARVQTSNHHTSPTGPRTGALNTHRCRMKPPGTASLWRKASASASSSATGKRPVGSLHTS